MIATQRTDGQFVDVRTDTCTVCFRRPTLEQYKVLQDHVAAGRVSSGLIQFALACADNKGAAEALFDEWPGAMTSVARARWLRW